MAVVSKIAVHIVEMIFGLAAFGIAFFVWFMAIPMAILVPLMFLFP